MIFSDEDEERGAKMLWQITKIAPVYNLESTYVHVDGVNDGLSEIIQNDASVATLYSFISISVSQVF